MTTLFSYIAYGESKCFENYPNRYWNNWMSNTNQIVAFDDWCAQIMYEFYFYFHCGRRVFRFYNDTVARARACTGRMREQRKRPNFPIVTQSGPQSISRSPRRPPRKENIRLNCPRYYSSFSGTLSVVAGGRNKKILSIFIFYEYRSRPRCKIF